MKQSRVTVVGLGYIGLPMALLLAAQKQQVTGFDLDQQKVDALHKGKLYFNEAGLPELFTQAAPFFTATTTISEADTFIVAVPTPQEAGKADLKYVFSALDEIENVFQPGNLIIVESTIGPRDSLDQLIPYIQRWGKAFHFAHCPERAIPGSTLREMVHNTRIIGAEDTQSQQLAQQVYAAFVKGEILLTDTTTAAACKVMENTYRAVNIALANEFAQLAEKVGFNVWEAIALANHHPRVTIHQPGPGVGGHCIPIDPWFFVSYKIDNSLIEHALMINKNMETYIASQVKRLIKQHNLEQPTIGFLGYAYKPNIDDARETPTQGIIEQLAGFKVLVHDPLVTHTPPDIELLPLETVLSESDIIVITTGHDQYKQLDFSKYQNIICIYDSHSCLPDTTVTTSHGQYYALGVPTSTHDNDNTTI
jgi:UDP-N-acetyl-D-mannosaminuronic acid dehydrogenase